MRTRTAWLFIAPLLLALATVAAFPLLRVLGYSLTDATLFAPERAHLVGLANYLGRVDGSWSGVLADPDWWRAVRNTLSFAVASVALETALGLGIALLLQRPMRAGAVLRAAVLVPWAIPTVVSSQLWAWMLDGQSGAINAWLHAAGVLAQPLAWTADPRLALFAITLVDVWKSTPFVALLLLAGLQTLPRDCYEAARVDGVPRWRVFWHVTLPLLRPALAVALVFRTIDALRVFDIIYVMTGSMPQTASISIYAQQQLVGFREVGYGSAASTLVFFLVALCVLVMLRVGRVQPLGRAR